MTDATSPHLTRVAARVLAVLGLVTAGLGLAVTSHVARAGATSARSSVCVAVVVDARSVGGPVSTGCEKGHPGATGLDVLSDAGFRLTFRNDGLVCAINGLPTSGCSGVDDSHYWAYFHRAAGSSTWVYSNQGPATYVPASGTTEGWVYDDGSSLRPDDIPYDRLCPAVAAASPSATPTPRARSTPSRSPSASTHPRHHVTSTPTVAPSTPRTKHPHPAHSAVLRRHRRSPTPLPATPTASGIPTSATASSSGDGYGGVLGVIIGAVIVVALGTTAAVVTRRRG